MGFENCGFSETECKIIKAQIQRRKQMREEFLKKRSDPYQHAKGAGHVVNKINFYLLLLIIGIWMLMLMSSSVCLQAGR